MTFKEEMKERTEVIEKLLVKYLPKAEGYQSQIMEAMEYSVMAGGKRLRPMLMQETFSEEKEKISSRLWQQWR